MHDLQFALAARPARFVILGLPMRPYSVGHELQLFAQENPILFTGFENLDEPVQNSALIRACLVCQRDWLSRNKPHKWTRIWTWRNRNTDFKSAIESFKKYREQGSLFPPSPAAIIDRICNGKESASGRSLGSPYHARLINFLSKLPERQVHDMGGETIFDVPYGMANFIYRAEIECDGGTKVLNEREAQITKEREGHLNKINSQKKEVECQPS